MCQGMGKRYDCPADTSLKAYKQKTLAELLNNPQSVPAHIAQLKEALPLLDLSVALQLFPALLFKVIS